MRELDKEKRGAVEQRDSGLEARAAAEEIIRDLAEQWPHGLVERDKFSEFSGHQLSPGYLANLDSQGVGIKGKFYLGRRACYPVPSCIDFLLKRIR